MRQAAIFCFSALLSFAALTTATRATQILPANTTDVTLISADTLAALGISVTPTGTAMLAPGSSPPEVMFPITGGTATGAALMIEHNGSGLALSDGTTTVTIGNFLVDTQQLEVFSYLGAPAAPTIPIFNIVAGSPLELTLTAAAAGALNAAFDTDAFSANLAIGTVVTNPVLAPEAPTWAMMAGGFIALALAARRQARLRLSGS
jgi:hypothetical protein